MLSTAQHPLEPSEKLNKPPTLNTRLSTIMSDEAFVMELNNLCQQRRLTPEWAEMHTGAQNVLTWTVAVSFDGIEFGRGSSRSKKHAKELAAEMALRALKAQISAA
ncbi:hypothetical protein C8Q73DRAFT_788884 [Cubamyces lactineus]|nr:hypothetical protein C8Q73DRAFT_788884 [Cubamyces lactineus]